MAGKDYFGKNNIRPSFLSHSDAKNLLKTTEKIATENTSLKSPSFSYHSSGRSSSKSSKLNNLKKNSPLLVIIGAIVIFVFVTFFMTSTLGNQIEQLVTRATDTMFGAYSENTLTVTSELLAGKRGNFPEKFKNRLEKQNILVSGTKDSSYTLTFQNEQITSNTLKDVYKTNINFREAFTRAKRGRTANFFDSSAIFALNRLGISRNLYRNYQKTGDEKIDHKNYHQTEFDSFDNTTKVSINTVTEKQKLDKNGKPIIEKVKSGENIVNSSNGDTRVKAKEFLSSTAGRAAGAGNLACNVLRVGNLVSTAIAAAELYKSIHLFIHNAENISKTTAGYGNSSAQTSFFNILHESVTTKYTDAKTGEEKDITGSPLQSEGAATMLAFTPPNLNKTRNYSLESAFITTATAAGLTFTTHKLCGGVRATSAVISIAVGVLGGGISTIFASLAKSVVINVALQQGITVALSALIPRIASSMFENSADSLKGIPLGENFFKGAALYNKKLARETSGQLLADKATATAYAQQTALANAEESALNRKNSSPLDISNSDTFLGSIMSKFAISLSRNSIFSIFNSFSHLTHYSFNKLNTPPQTFAENLITKDYQPDTELTKNSYGNLFAKEDTCQNLTNINAACDIYGIEITATNPKMLKISSQDPKYQSILHKNFTKNKDGTYELKPNSLASKKLIACDNRDSLFGTLDPNIVNALTTSLGPLDHLPILNDALDIVNVLEEMSPEVEGWGTGSYCVLNDQNPYREELEYIQLIQDRTRIATQLELDEVKNSEGIIKNPFLAFTEKYYRDNPIDTSRAGLLARYTGTTKKHAEEILALVDYSTFISTYSPPTNTTSSNITFSSTSPNHPSHIAHTPKYLFLYNLRMEDYIS